MAAPSLAPMEQIHRAHAALVPLSRKGGCISALAGIITLTALLVITAAALTSIIQGVNVMRDVVLRGVCPGMMGLLIAIPLIIKSIKVNRVKNELFRRLVAAIKARLEAVDFASLSKDEQVESIRSLFPSIPNKPKAGRIYRTYVLAGVTADLSKKPKEHTPAQKALLEAIKEASKQDFKSPTSKNKKE